MESTRHSKEAEANELAKKRSQKRFSAIAATSDEHRRNKKIANEDAKNEFHFHWNDDDRIAFLFVSWIHIFLHFVV